MKLSQGLIVLTALGLMAGCAPKEVILKGTRLDIRTPLSDNANPKQPSTEPRNVPVRLPAQAVNADWVARGGDASHHIRQPALAATLSPAWSVSIGEGGDKRHRISADPVVAGGRIFTLDSRATVAATSTDGKSLWSRDLTPPGDHDKDASGGGLAYGDGTLFATSSFGELVALDPATGKELWRQSFDAPITSAPTVSGGTVYVVSRNAVAWAIDARTGRVDWQLPGTPSIATQMEDASPAVSGQVVVFPFGSEDMIGALKSGGYKLWNTTVGGRRLGRAYADIPGISGDPVIVGGTVYVGNATGRVAAYGLHSGKAEWTSSEGTTGPVVPAGDALYLLSDDARLVRLNRATGKVVWKVALPYYTTDKTRKRREIYVHFGPTLAGNRLRVASSDGMLRSFDPASGAVLQTLPMGAPAATDPVVAGRTLYVVTEDGKLRAFR